MTSNWPRKHNAFYRRPSGSVVIESSLPRWQVALGTGLLLLGVGVPWPPLYAYEMPQVCALLLLLAAVGLLYTGLFSSLEIGPAGVVLRRFGWFWPAERVPLSALVLREQGGTPAGRRPRLLADERLHLEWGAPCENEADQLFITYRGRHLDHVFDDEFAWSSLQRAAAQQRLAGATTAG
ncbi:hypothetical protein EJV47_05165 [Hymenobacter gummosus]|uniref:Uncharacterized protein n=1 Tax=Hymenobacter gummosus TaxID=1776032 RepID=A0A3S0QK87_9BACT|nr:hypothetical protein [Hymenobacter gummosus]RTQ52406.1 hypothetical protein EJV47_05165 [Hymenobacter gummosus]